VPAGSCPTARLPKSSCRRSAPWRSVVQQSHRADPSPDLVGLGQVRMGMGMSRWQVGQVPAQRSRSVCISRTTW
jgi:hypothetical protein